MFSYLNYLTKELFVHGNIFCFILFHNKVTSSNKSLEIWAGTFERRQVAETGLGELRHMYCKKGNDLTENNLYTDAKQLNHWSEKYFILFCVFIIFTIIYISYPENRLLEICFKNRRQHWSTGVVNQSNPPTVDVNIKGIRTSMIRVH